VLLGRPDGVDRLVEVRELLKDHREAGSALAARLLLGDDLPGSIWVVEPIAAATTAEPAPAATVGVSDPAGTTMVAPLVSVAAAAEIDGNQPSA
jgi:hypothetical protein